jgi:hypothetical protein
MIRVYGHWMRSALEKVTPLLKRIHYSEEFLVVNLIVDISSRELPRIKCDQMKLSIYAHL